MFCMLILAIHATRTKLICYSLPSGFLLWFWSYTAANVSNSIHYVLLPFSCLVQVIPYVFCTMFTFAISNVDCFKQCLDFKHKPNFQLLGFCFQSYRRETSSKDSVFTHYTRSASSNLSSDVWKKNTYLLISSILSNALSSRFFSNY